MVVRKYIGKFMSWSAIMQEICTKGPILPIERPAANAAVRPKVFTKKAPMDKFSGSTTPLSTVFISGTPDPAARGQIKYVVEAEMHPARTEKQT